MGRAGTAEAETKPDTLGHPSVPLWLPPHLSSSREHTLLSPEAGLTLDTHGPRLELGEEINPRAIQVSHSGACM